MRPVLRYMFITVALTGAFVAAWSVLLWRWTERVAPGGATLSACLVKMPHPARAAVFVRGGRDYLVLEGETQAFPRFPSGPSMYVFNDCGELVSWVADNGDAEQWWINWPELRNSRVIDDTELMRWPGAKP